MTAARSQGSKPGHGKPARRGLGAGLLGQGQGSNVADLLPHLATHAEAGGEALREIPVGLVGRSPYQPRQTFDRDRLQELADSIGEHGVLEPVLVRPAGGGRYELLAGERRLEASKLAGRATVTARVRDVDDLAAAAIGLTENLAREDLSDYDAAHALARLQDTLEAATRPNTVRDLARLTGWSKSKVGRALQIARGVSPALLARAVPGWDRAAIPESALLTAAQAPTAAAKAQALKAAHGETVQRSTTLRGRHAADATGAAPLPYRLTTRDDGRFTLELRAAPAAITPAKARALLEALAPHLATLRQRAKAPR